MNRRCPFILITSLIFIVSFFQSSLAFAVDQSGYISGPSGESVDGYYKDSFTMNFWYRADNKLCDAGPTREYIWNNTSAPSGNHLYEFYFLSLVGMIAYKIDGGEFQTFIPFTNSEECFVTQYSTKFHAAYISVDKSAPIIQFDESLNNLHTKDSTYRLTGTVFDDTSGGTKVLVNGISAGYITQTSGTFERLVYLDKVGPNIFSAVATDVVGHTTSSAPITIYRDSISNGSASNQPSTSDRQQISPEIDKKAANDNVNHNIQNKPYEEKQSKSNFENKYTILLFAVGVAVVGLTLVSITLKRFRPLRVIWSRIKNIRKK